MLPTSASAERAFSIAGDVFQVNSFKFYSVCFFISNWEQIPLTNEEINILYYCILQLKYKILNLPEPQKSPELKQHRRTPAVQGEQVCFQNNSFIFLTSTKLSLTYDS